MTLLRRRLLSMRGPFDPQRLLGTDLIAWWDARDVHLMTMATGVASWHDRVGDHDAMQATGAAQPVWSASSFGGDAGVSFDGVDDALACTSAALLARLPAGAVPGELWVLEQQDALVADATTRVALSTGGALHTSRLLGRGVVLSTNRGRGTVGDSVTSASVDATTVDLSSRHVLRLQIGASASVLSVDQAAPLGGSVVPASDAARLRLGARATTAAAQFWQGQIAAALVTLPLDAARAAALTTYLMSRRRL